MIQHGIVTTGLTGLVGWDSPTLPNLPALSTANTTSSSGLKFNNAHSLVSLRNIYDTQENKDITDDQFNSLLDAWKNDVIIRVANDIYGQESRHLETKVLFPFERTFKNTLTPGSGFVCISIKPPLNRRIVYVINSVSLAFDSAESITVKLYNSGKKTPLQTKAITTVAGEETKESLGWVISSVGNTYPGGTFYLGYTEGTAKPYKRDWDQSNDYLTGAFFNEFFRLPESGGIDVTDYETLEEPYGLNIDWSVYVDYTDLIISNKQLFSNAIYYGMAIKVLQQIRSTTRANVIERLTEDFRAIADFELDASKNSIMAAYTSAISELKNHFHPRIQVKSGQLC